jgi:hypothetical protein
MVGQPPLHRVLASCLSRGTTIVTLGILLLLSFPLAGEQPYVARFDVYGGYGFLNSPAVSLFEHGFAVQAGFRPKTWMSFGVDYTFGSGDLTIRPDQLLPELQEKLHNGIVAGVGAGKLPANYPYSSLSVSAHSRTHTIAVGPQLAYRRLSKATLFFRPVYAGIMHEAATPQPQDAVVKALLSSLITTPTKTDNVLFIGFGGGFDILFGNHFAWRTQGDFVYDHLFTDLMTNGRFTTRFSCGPAYNFGPNIVKRRTAELKPPKN